MSKIELENIVKKYTKNTETIKNLSLSVESGEFIVFVGPSGCGKSTMLRMIAGLESITQGTLKIDGQVMNQTPPEERQIAMVFQSYALYPHMNVFENMGFSLKMRGEKKDVVKQQVQKVAESLKLDHLLEQYPKQLSGGQRQRVAIGRAIVRHPKVFLFDEPLSNLDASLRSQMRVELRKLHIELGVTMVYVTHDQTEAMTLGQRIVVFNNGIIEQVGVPMELYSEPANRFVAEFLGSPKMNFLPFSWDEQAQSARICNTAILKKDLLPENIDFSRVKNLGVRPENIQLDESGIFEGKLDFYENLGDSTIVYTSLKQNSLKIKVPGALQDGLSNTIRFTIKPENMLFFDSEDRAICP